MLSTIIKCVTLIHYFAECHYAECRYAECRGPLLVQHYDGIHQYWTIEVVLQQKCFVAMAQVLSLA
jgi:hypothetical protein